MPRSAWSPATATWVTARSPYSGGRHEYRACFRCGARTADARADAREPALLGRPAGRQADAAALHRLREGAALSAAGLPALLLDGQRIQAGATHRHGPYLDGVPSPVQLFLQGR